AGIVDGTGYDKVVIEDGVTVDGNIDVATDATVRARGKVTSDGTFGPYAIYGEARSSVENEGAIEVTAGGTAIQLTGENIRVVNHQGATISATGSGGALGVVFSGSSGTLDNAGEITVAGDRAVGFSVVGEGHVVENRGLIAASGEEASALTLAGLGSELSNYGVISATGDESYALFVTGNGVSVNNASRGHIFAEGEGAHAMSLAGTGNRLSNEGRIEARGESVIAANTAGSELTVTNLAGGVITATGEYSAGVAFSAAMSEMVNAGTIEAAGVSARGVAVSGAGNSIDNQHGGSIFASGEAASAMVLGGENVTVVNAGAIRSEGGQSFGIIAVDGPGGHTIENTATASVRAQGYTSVGIYLGGTGTKVTNSGLVSAEGEAAAAINVSGSGHVIENLPGGGSLPRPRKPSPLTV